MWIEFHQPDVPSEVAEHEDDLIGRGDWRRADRYAGISISVDAYTAIGSPSTSPDAEVKCRARTALRTNGFVPKDV